MQQLVKACGCRCFSAALNAACHCELFCISVHSHPNLNFVCSVVRSLEIFYFKKHLNIGMIEHLNHAFYYGNMEILQITKNLALSSLRLLRGVYLIIYFLKRNLFV